MASAVEHAACVTWQIVIKMFIPFPALSIHLLYRSVKNSVIPKLHFCAYDRSHTIYCTIKYITITNISLSLSLSLSGYGVHEVGVIVCGVQHVLGVRVRPEIRHFSYNENPTRALHSL